MESRILQIPPVKTPTRKPSLYPLKQPFQLDPSCVLALLPQRDDHWHDYSGHGNHGTITGATWTGKGRLGPALSFDGVDDHVNCGNNSSLATKTNFTYEVWLIRKTENIKEIYLNNLAGTQIWATINEGGNQKIGVYLGGTSSPGYHHSNTAVTKNVLHHIAFTYDTTKGVFYLDGKADGEMSTTGTLSALGNTLTIGQRDDLAAFNQFTGYINFVAVYNRALTADEIRRNYEWGRVR